MNNKVHLFVLVHGLWGNGTHLTSMKEELLASYAERTHDGSPELVLLLAQSNEGELTYDGIDFCASRVVEEVDGEIYRLEQIEGKQVVSFSTVGYSLGGLVARYMLGILHARPEGFFDRHKPVNFATFASPWIGMPRYSTVINSFTTAVGSRLLSKTGAQLYCVDEERLIHRMSRKGDVFYKALEQFKRVDNYVNAVHDRTVPFPTGGFSADDPFDGYEKNGLEIEMDDDLPIIKSYYLPSLGTVVSSRSSSPPSPARLKRPEHQKRKPILPPKLRYRFPFNILVFCLLPVLMPLLMIAILGFFVKSGIRSSRRLKDQTNMPVWERLKSIEQAVEHEFAKEVEEATGYGQESASLSGERKKGPLRLSEDQLEAIRTLDRLPNLQKHLVFFPDAYNSHAMIIGRDPVGFPDHGRGRVVLRSWADSIEL